VDLLHLAWSRAYLTEEAVFSTLGFIASLPNGAHVVFDYGDPPASLSPGMRASHDRRAARVAGLGEPWMSLKLSLIRLFLGGRFDVSHDLEREVHSSPARSASPSTPRTRSIVSRTSAPCATGPCPGTSVSGASCSIRASESSHCRHSRPAPQARFGT